METNTIGTGQTLYTAKTHTVGGRDGGRARSSDGRLDIRLSVPGSTGAGTNPEQLFAAGWSACFEGAMGRAAKELNVIPPAGTAIDAEVDLCRTDNWDFFLRVRLNIGLPGIPQETARAIADRAHQICPYSKATRGNIEVEINLI